jgi:hypothetical protein
MLHSILSSLSGFSRLQGHIKLSDFGLCTGLKKAHRTDFYRMQAAEGKEGSATTSAKERIKTWKTLRRALV